MKQKIKLKQEKANKMYENLTSQTIYKLLNNTTRTVSSDVGTDVRSDLYR